MTCCVCFCELPRCILSRRGAEIQSLFCMITSQNCSQQTRFFIIWISAIGLHSKKKYAPQAVKLLCFIFILKISNAHRYIYIYFFFPQLSKTETDYCKHSDIIHLKMYTLCVNRSENNTLAYTFSQHQQNEKGNKNIGSITSEPLA